MEKVHVAVGPNRTDTGMAAKSLIQKAQIPTFMNVGGDPVITGGKFGPFKWNWKSPQRSSVAIKRVYMYLKKKKIKEIAMLVDSSGFGMDGKVHIERLAPKYGMKIVASETAHPKDTDVTPQLTRIKATDAEAIFSWVFGPATAIVSKNVKQLKIKIPKIENHGMAGPRFLQIAGKDAEGDYFVSSKINAAEQLPDTDPCKKVNLELLNIYKQHNRPIHAQSSYAYDMICIVIDALKKAGTDRFKLRDAIEQTRGFVGATGVFNMTPEDHNGLGVDSMHIIQVVDGKWKLIDY
jgi:branched-chain amino acid transport system substrate-binding protein